MVETIPSPSHSLLESQWYVRETKSHFSIYSLHLVDRTAAIR